MEVCKTETTKNKPFSAEFWTEHDNQMKEYWEEHGLILKAPTSNNQTGLTCPPKPWALDPLHLYPNFSAKSYTVTPDGRLHGHNIEYQHQRNAHTGDFFWDNDKFCVSYADMDNEYEPDDVFELTYHTCTDGSKPPECQDHEDFLSSFNPVALSISIFFLLLTIAVFVWYKKINSWDRANMMKIAFLVNLTIAYIVR